MYNYNKSSFNNTKVIIDDSSFRFCEFKNCILTYSGSDNVTLENCTFIDVTWEFSGKAANTLQFLKLLYNGMGRDGEKLVLDLIYEVTGKRNLQKI